jgi:hypothetical protein
MRQFTFVLLLITTVGAACNRDATTPAATAPPTEGTVTPGSPPHLAPGAPKPSAAAAEVAGRTGVATAPPAERGVVPAVKAAARAVVDKVRDREVTIPAGTTLAVALTSAVSSNGSSVEDAVSGTLQRPIVIDGLTVVPSGAAVSGYVTDATRSGKVKGRARVGFRLTSLRAGDVRYEIRTTTIAREAKDTKKEDAVKIGIGAGAGAVVGAITGGKKGAAIGTAVGAGGGTGVVLATRGEEVSFSEGSVVTTSLTAPVTVRVRVQ